jgi:hypothetical protein
MTISLTHRLVEQRIALQNRASNMLSACGLNLIEEALSSEEKLTALLELPRDELVRMQLRVIAGQIRTLDKSIAERAGVGKGYDHWGPTQKGVG